MISNGLYFFLKEDAPVIFPYSGVDGVLVTENDGLAKTVGRLMSKSNSQAIRVYKFGESVEDFINIIRTMGVNAIHCITVIDDNSVFKATTYIFEEKK